MYVCMYVCMYIGTMPLLLNFKLAWKTSTSSSLLSNTFAPRWVRSSLPLQKAPVTPLHGNVCMYVCMYVCTVVYYVMIYKYNVCMAYRWPLFCIDLSRDLLCAVDHLINWSIFYHTYIHTYIHVHIYIHKHINIFFQWCSFEMAVNGGHLLIEPRFEITHTYTHTYMQNTINLYIHILRTLC